MNNNSSIKYWNDEEESQLINEINKLTDIDDILKNHNRKITGILMRIEKIINDPVKYKDVLNRNKIIEKYLTNSKNKYFIDNEELYTNILKFNSLDEISNKYNKISQTKLKIILSDFLKRKDIDISKKLRIKCLLKKNTEDIDIDFVKNVLNSDLQSTTHIEKSNIYEDLDVKLDLNTNKNNNLNDITSIMINILEEIKTMKIDIFDIKSRVKIIMKKVEIIEKKNLDKNIMHTNIMEKNIIDDNIMDINIDNNMDINKYIDINNCAKKIIISKDTDKLNNEHLKKEFKNTIN